MGFLDWLFGGETGVGVEWRFLRLHVPRGRATAGCASRPNMGLQPTPYSLRSSVAPASRRG